MTRQTLEAAGRERAPGPHPLRPAGSDGPDPSTRPGDQEVLHYRTPTHSDLHRGLVEAALRAPSADNNQPWRFFSDGRTLEIHLDRDRLLSTDINGRYDLLATGAAVENACIAAREAGYEALLTADPAGALESAQEHRPVATIECWPGGAGDSLDRFIGLRCTNRKSYAKTPPTGSQLERLTREAARFRGIGVEWVTDRRRIRALARMAWACDRIRLEHEGFHREMFGMMRLTPEEVEASGDGLDVRTLELPPGFPKLIGLLGQWRRMVWLRRLRLTPLLMLPSAMAVLRSGAVGVLTIPKNAPELAFDGGRAMERVWLAATAEGLAVQPVGAGASMFAIDEQLGGRGLEAGHLKTVRHYRERFCELVPALANEQLLVLLRIGLAPEPEARSQRRKVDQVLESVAEDGVPR